MVVPGSVALPIPQRNVQYFTLIAVTLCLFLYVVFGHHPFLHRRISPIPTNSAAKQIACELSLKKKKKRKERESHRWEPTLSGPGLEEGKNKHSSVSQKPWQRMTKRILSQQRFPDTYTLPVWSNQFIMNQVFPSSEFNGGSDIKQYWRWMINFFLSCIVLY